MDEGGHHWGVAADVAVKGELVAGAVEVVCGILDFVVGVAAQVVGEEAYALHEGEQSDGIGQMLHLDRSEEVAGRLEIARREGFEDGFVEAHAGQVGVVLGGEVGTGAQEVAIVREDE